jgi:hypothetical protein
MSQPPVSACPSARIFLLRLIVPRQGALTHTVRNLRCHTDQMKFLSKLSTKGSVRNRPERDISGPVQTQPNTILKFSLLKSIMQSTVTVSISTPKAACVNLHSAADFIRRNVYASSAMAKSLTASSWASSMDPKSLAR